MRRLKWANEDPLAPQTHQCHCPFAKQAHDALQHQQAGTLTRFGVFLLPLSSQTLYLSLPTENFVFNFLPKIDLLVVAFDSYNILWEVLYSNITWKLKLMQNMIMCIMWFSRGDHNARVLWCELAASRVLMRFVHCNDLKGSDDVLKQVLRKPLFVLGCSSQGRYGLAGP